MRISDWSSDVCSSDLLIVEGQAPVAAEHLRPRLGGALIVAGGSTRYSAEAILAAGNADLVAFGRHFIASPGLPERFRRSSSEARRVGKDGVSTCRSRGSPYH